MPVVLPTATIPDPPEPPASYFVTGFEVEEVANSPAECDRGRLPFLRTADGWEAAANEYVARGIIGQRLAVVAWWIERPMDECRDGWERVVSVFDPVTARWGRWKPESVVGDPPRLGSREKRLKASRFNATRPKRMVMDGVTGNPG